jgi:hypothetical protein
MNLGENASDKLIKLAQNEIERITSKKEDPQIIANALAFLSNLSQQLPLSEPLARDYIKFAEIDYQSARLLLENKIYPSAIFHLQQTIEKLAKAYALHLGLVKEEDLYPKGKRKGRSGTVGHISPRAFISVLKRKGAIDIVYIVFTLLKEKSCEEIKKDIKNFESLLWKEELAVLSREDILSLLQQNDKIIENLSKIDRRVVKFEIEKRKLGLSTGARQMGLPISNSIKGIPINQSMVEEIFQKLITFVRLYILTIITFPHFSYPRYPSKGHGVVYEEGLGIVECANDLLSMTGEMLEEIKRAIGGGDCVANFR